LFTWATVRAEFEKHRNVKDLRKSKMLMEEGEHRLFQHQHLQPTKFFWSPGGIGHGREMIYPDSHLDHYHPLEKAQFPYYFEKREKRKQDYIAMYEKTYGVKAEKQLEEYSSKKHYEPEPE
jgi:NADH dehydrogenase (ubiquinone) 1 beta subcomplex subunit 9